MIEHIVLVKFKEASEGQLNEIVERLANLKDIPGVIAAQAGISMKRDHYDIGLTVRFEDEESLKNYGPHPIHQGVVAYLTEVGVKDLKVVDFEI